jgi:hypothetical protein
MTAYSTDIGNAYLTSKTQEKVCIQAGPEFGELEEHLLVLYKALYGLRLSGKQFGDYLADCLKSLGFFQSRAEPQIFMRLNKQTQLWEYVACNVDNLCIVMKDPKTFLKQLQSPPFNFKLKGSGELKFRLGRGFHRDGDDVLYMDPGKYIQKMEESYLQIFGSNDPLLPKYQSPLEEGDHPELDTSKFLCEDCTQKYQSLIGSMQWLITLGRWDI